MCRWIIPADNFVDRKHWAKIEIQLLAKLAVDLVHMSAELFQHALQAIENRIQRGLISSEIVAHEVFKGGGVTIFFAPELGHLPQASLNSCVLRGPVLGGQFIVQFYARIPCP